MPIVCVYHHDNEATLFNTDCTAGSLIAALSEIANGSGTSRGGGAGGRYSKVELLPLSFVMDLANNTKVASALSPHRTGSVVSASVAEDTAGAGASDGAGAGASKGSAAARASASFSTSSNTAALNALVHNVPFSGLLLAPVQQLASDTLSATAGFASTSGGAFSGSSGNSSGNGAASGSAAHGHSHSGSSGPPTIQNSYILLGCRETVVPATAALTGSNTAIAATTAGTTMASTTAQASAGAGGIGHSGSVAYPTSAGGGASSAARMLKQQQQQQQQQQQGALSTSQQTLFGSAGQGAATSTGAASDARTLSTQTVSQLLHQAQLATETPVPSSFLSPDAANAVLTAAEVAKALAASSSPTKPASGGSTQRVAMMAPAGAGAHDEDASEVISAPRLFVVSIEEEEKALVERIAAQADVDARAHVAAEAAGAAAPSSGKTSGNNSARQGSATTRRRSPSTKRASTVGAANQSGMDSTHETDPSVLVGQPPSVAAAVPLSQAATHLLYANTSAAPTAGGGGGGGVNVQVSLQTCNVTAVKGGGGGAASAGGAGKNGSGAGASSSSLGLLNAGPGAPSQHVLDQLESFDVLWRGPQNEQELLRAFLQEYVRTLKQRFEVVQASMQSDGASSARRSTVGQTKTRKR